MFEWCRLPSSLGFMTGLKEVEVTNNQLNDTLPVLCQMGPNSPLTDLLISGNEFSGEMYIGWCPNLVFINANVSACFVTWIRVTAAFPLL